jgi:hypothetical protein
MLWSVTPRLEVLAELTGLGEEPEGPPADGPSADAEEAEEPDGEVATQTAVPAMTAPTSSTVRIWIERGRRMK